MGQMIRQAHASLDVLSRRKKAEKIARLLQLDKFSQPICLLEIGCGSGVIAHYFAAHPVFTCHVTAVDLLDLRVEKDSYHFEVVQGSQLPFDDASFDVVISNHVIEHVGNSAQQLTHLSEIRRVMKPPGSGYLAVPNRWMVTEPHYQLPFLSWLPANLRSAYLRISGKGTHYDCRPLSARSFEKTCVCGWIIRNKFGVASLVRSIAQRSPFTSAIEGCFVGSKDIIGKVCRVFSDTNLFAAERSRNKFLTEEFRRHLRLAQVRVREIPQKRR